jgi:uncharacterized protein (DUF608 family)
MVIIKTLFPTDLPSSAWLQFQAEGFTVPVCGVLYDRLHPATNGMPLGGVDTGCLDLETSGLWGYSTLFNTHVPRMGPINLPFLGLNVDGQTWVLCDPTQVKPYQILQAFGTPLQLPPDFPQSGGAFTLEGVRTPAEIHYWGHYPVADLEYEIDAPLSVGLRAWAPFLPGDLEISMLPAAVFEVHLRNPTPSAMKGALAFSFPGPTEKEAGGLRYLREEVHGAFNGIAIQTPKAGYALGVIGRERLRWGAALDADGAAWARIAQELPAEAKVDPSAPRIAEPKSGPAGASLAVDFELQAGEEKIVRFVLAWHAPDWEGGGYPWSAEAEYPAQPADGSQPPLQLVPSQHTYTHMYARTCLSAVHAAFAIAGEHARLLERILAWQQVLYTDAELPPWLQDVLVNNLHLITEVGMWAQARPPIGDWCLPEDGLWGLNECPRGCPQIECGGNSYYGGFAVQYFFPQLAKSSLRAAKAYQYPDGLPPWVFGGTTGRTPPVEMVLPTRGYQNGQTPSWYVAMVARHWDCTHDDAFLGEFYPFLKKATRYTFELNPEQPYGLLSLPDFDLQEGYESTPFTGMSSHVGSVRLFHLKMMAKIAHHLGDAEFAGECQAWFEQASRLMEKHLWTGSYYLQHRDIHTGQVASEVMGYQLDGEFMACSGGLPEGVFPRDRVQITLDTLSRVSDGPWGARVWSDPAGGPVRPKAFETGYWSPHGVHAPGALMLAMTYLYRGQRVIGLDLAQRVMENMVCRQGWTWDLPILYRADSGEGIWGNDYSQMMVCWALPSAVKGKDAAALAAPGELVDRIIQACRSGSH